jgi:hypothetical protein
VVAPKRLRDRVGSKCRVRQVEKPASLSFFPLSDPPSVRLPMYCCLIQSASRTAGTAEKRSQLAVRRSNVRYRTPTMSAFEKRVRPQRVALCHFMPSSKRTGNAGGRKPGAKSVLMTIRDQRRGTDAKRIAMVSIALEVIYWISRALLQVCSSEPRLI